MILKKFRLKIILQISKRNYIKDLKEGRKEVRINKKHRNYSFFPFS
jgi:hypothetical protein